jgi:hypothetical protein
MKFREFVTKKNNKKQFDLAGVYREVTAKGDIKPANEYPELKGKIPGNIPVMQVSGGFDVYDYSHVLSRNDEVIILRTRANLTARGAVTMGNSEIIERVNVDSEIGVPCQ